MNGRDWPALRALSAETILEAIGARQFGKHYVCPRKFCGGLFVAHDDPASGVSIQCSRQGCMLDAWNWPEVAIALSDNISVHAASARLLAAARIPTHA